MTKVLSGYRAQLSADAGEFNRPRHYIANLTAF